MSCNRDAACHCFHATVSTTNTQRSARVGNRVTDFASHRVCAVPNFSVDDPAAADARADGDVQQTCATLSRPKSVLTERGTYDQSRQVFADLAELGISYDDVVRVLEEEGVDKFAVSWTEFLGTIEANMGAVEKP